MSHFVALCTEFVAWSEETANIMSDKDPAPEEVRHTSAFTMIEGQSMDDVLDNTAHQAHDDTESDSSDGDSVGQKRDGSFKSNPVAAGGLRKQLKKRRVDRNTRAQHFDAIMESMAADEGRLNIRTIEELTHAAGAGDGLLKTGDKFGCRQEVLVRIAEDNELQQRMYSTHSSKKGGGRKGWTAAIARTVPSAHRGQCVRR